MQERPMTRPLVTLKAKFPTLSRSTRHRWRRTSRYGLPAPEKTVNGIEYYDEEKLDRWQPPAGPTAADRTARFTSRQRSADTPSDDTHG
jgi:hypothetical protein